MHTHEDCAFYTVDKSVHCLFFRCITAKQIWIGVPCFFQMLLVKIMNLLPILELHTKITMSYIMYVHLFYGMVKNQECTSFNGQSWIDVKQIWKLILSTRQRLIINNHMMVFGDNFKEYGFVTCKNLILPSFSGKVYQVLETLFCDIVLQNLIIGLVNAMNRGCKIPIDLKNIKQLIV